MKIRTIQDVEELKDAVSQCSHDVWLESPKGDRYSLKAPLGQYVAISALIQDDKEELEMFANDHCDQMIMMDYLRKHIA